MNRYPRIDLLRSLGIPGPDEDLSVPPGPTSIRNQNDLTAWLDLLGFWRFEGVAAKGLAALAGTRASMTSFSVSTEETCSLLKWQVAL